jgi:predicted nucleic acid-binding protein
MPTSGARVALDTDVAIASTTEVYARVRLALKKKGRPIPENDMWIAALCVEHALPFATYDEHFDEVEGLTLAGFRSPG